MFDHDKAIEAAWKKAERIEKEMETKRKKQRRVLAVTSIIAVACVLGLIGWRSMNRLKPDNTDSGKNITHITNHPTGIIEGPQNTLSVTSIPINTEAVRPKPIYVRSDKEEEGSKAESDDDLTPGDIKIGSQSLQKVLDDTRDNNIFFEIEIWFCVSGVSDSDWKRVAEKETEHIKEQGIYVERVNAASVDVVISKEQLVGLAEPEDCAYWILWSGVTQEER